MNDNNTIYILESLKASIGATKSVHKGINEVISHYMFPCDVTIYARQNRLTVKQQAATIIEIDYINVNQLCTLLNTHAEDLISKSRMASK